jgi:hypothetical protein
MKQARPAPLALVLGAGALAAALCTGAAEVKLDAPTQQRIGITTLAVQAVQHRAEAQGLGQVIGLDALAQTDAELTGAEAAARSSEAALQRARGLYNADTSVSRQSLEAAERQAATDSVQLALARRKSIATWGRGAPWAAAGQRAALLAKVSAGTTAIVRATFPADAGAASEGAMRVEPLDGGTPHSQLSAASAWAAPADPAIPGRSYYLLVNGAEALTPGQRVRVFMPVGPSESGVLVPAGALVIAEGGTWLYVQEKNGAFVRRPISVSQPLGQGYFTPAVHPGERVVVQGAGQLLARETGTEAED